MEEDWALSVEAGLVVSWAPGLECPGPILEFHVRSDFGNFIFFSKLKLFPASKQLEIVPLAWMVVDFVALGHFGFVEPFG